MILQNMLLAGYVGGAVSVMIYRGYMHTDADAGDQEEFSKYMNKTVVYTLGWPAWGGLLALCSPFFLGYLIRALVKKRAGTKKQRVHDNTA